MTDNETKLTARLREAAAAFSRIVDLAEHYSGAYRPEPHERRRTRASLRHRQGLAEEVQIAKGRAEPTLIDTGKVMQEAALLLRESGITACYEHPGYISIPVEPGIVANFGNANGDYGGDIVSAATGEGRPNADGWLIRLSRTATAEQLAAAIKTWFKGTL